MGFRPEPTHYKLTFEDPALGGLEVTVAALSVDEFLSMSELAELGPADAAGAGGAAKKMLGTLGESLVSWNVEDVQGQPVPADFAGVRSQEFGFIFKIVIAWIEAQAAVSPNLLNGSSRGGTHPEESLQLANSSTSQPS